MRTGFFFSGPILCIALNTSGSVCYSGGLDATIQWWNLPPLMLDLFGSYGKSHHIDV